MTEAHAQPPAVDVDPTRIGAEVNDLRVHTARGTIVNSAYQVGLAALAVLERLVAAAFLTRSEFGLWIVILTFLLTLVWLKEVGIMDKYVQQSELDQEAAFQKAFTLELLLSLGFFVLVLVVVPFYALLYDHTEMILPAIVAATAVPLTALEAPAWIPYRRLDYFRQRVLMSVDPAVAFVVTVALAIAGAGYWCFVAGVVAGSAAGAIVCMLWSPYPLRLRIDRATVREYATFSWPLMGSGISRMLVLQGVLLTANRTVGLAGIGAIGLATQIAMITDKVDLVVSQTIYPAVCAVADRTKALFETFVKSNRLALMWGVPFGVGAALFAHDLVEFVIGDRWLPAVGTIAGVSLACAFGQVAFNWTVFMRATNRTRPLFVAAVLDAVVLLGVAIPGLIAFGLPGFVAGFAATTAVQIAVRGWYMSRMFGGFSVLRQLLRALLPALPAAALVLIVRQLAPGDRSPGRALAELALFVAVTVAGTWLLERNLIREVIGYLRGRGSNPLEPAAT
jgi:O-antigen/teichoic acid export membrane protein